MAGALGAVLAAAPTAEAMAKLPPPAPGPVNFARDIRPILEASCVKCHGRGKSKGDWSLETREAFLKESDSGLATLVGDSARSRLIHLVAGTDPDAIMPEKGSRLTPEQVGLLRAWVPDNIYGFWGIVLGEAIYTFPHALMILLSALSLADARLFDAASSMGASPWKAFRSITWPASRQGVFAAFCLVFTLTITDFGVPVVVGGDYQVLALEAYKAVVGQQQFVYRLLGAVAQQRGVEELIADGFRKRRPEHRDR